jgi:hypothetical protein
MHSFFAKVEDGVVTAVIVVPEEAVWNDRGVEEEVVGREYCQQFGEGLWVQTWPTGEKRKWYGGVGYAYREDLDAFVPPKPTEDCVLDEELCHWIAPDGTDLNVPPLPG